MAKFYPDRVTPTVVTSELRVRNSLRQLDDSWRVFHSITWQSLRAGRQGDGEADFVLLHRDFGAIVLEVKGGEIELLEGVWYSVDKNRIRHRIKNPFDQAKTSKYALVNYLRSLDPPLAHIPVCHAVVFPNVTLDHGIGLYGPRDIILDHEDLLDPNAAIVRVLEHWKQNARLTTDDVDTVTSRLAPTVTVRTRLRDAIVDSNEVLIQLTERQIQTFGQLRLVRRAAVLGGAGTGKTILAIERVRRLVSEGFKTLLTCYNSPLANFMTQELINCQNTQVTTFHALCVQEARKALLPIPTDPNEDWWEREAPNLLIRAAGVNHTAFDAIIVDEGQDFALDWLVSLLMLTSNPDESPFYVFADSHQELYRRGWALPEAWPKFSLDLNCRNTAPIAARVAALYEEKIASLGADGPQPVFVKANGAGEGIELVQSIVARLMQDEGINPKQIAVLSDSKAFVDDLRTMVVGDHAFTGIGGFGVVTETVNRFKGLESDVIVLVLTESVLTDPVRLRALSYVGMSRAKVVLFVLGSMKVRKAMGWT